MLSVVRKGSCSGSRTTAVSCGIRRSMPKESWTRNSSIDARGRMGIVTTMMNHQLHPQRQQNDACFVGATSSMFSSTTSSSLFANSVVVDSSVSKQCQRSSESMYSSSWMMMNPNDWGVVGGSKQQQTPPFLRDDNLEATEETRKEVSSASCNNHTVVDDVDKNMKNSTKTTSILPLLANLQDVSTTKLIWKESMNDYVFSIPSSSSSVSGSTDCKIIDIPLMHVLRSTIRQYASTTKQQGQQRNYNHHHYTIPFHCTNGRRQQRQLLQQQMSYFSTDTNSRKEEQQPDSIVKTSTISPPPGGSPYSRDGGMPSRKIGTTQIPTPSSAPPVQVNPLETLKQTTPKGLMRKGLDMTISVFSTVITFLLKAPSNIFYYITHPKERQEGIDKLRKTIKDEVHHYWVGTKLLWADIQTAQSLLSKTLKGSALTRRERRQLLRTVSDLFRLIPFSMFVIIPFMEFALPFALRIFPNLLPSTYQDSLKAEEEMKRELKTRIAMAQFFQETLEELAKEQKQKAAKKKEELEEAGVLNVDAEGSEIANQKDSAGSMLEFLEKARRGEMIPPDIIIRYAKYFQDDLTLDNMPRMQLINMCRYMGMPPYGNDNFLRFQLRLKIRNLKEDDQRILWEGIDSLTKMELREACQERGMRSTGLSKEAYKRNLQQWLDLSVNKDVPVSLLIMSRTFFLREEALEGQLDDASKNLTGLADAISGLDKEIVNEVILEVATAHEKISDRDVRKIKLEVLAQQNELIKEEAEAREQTAAKIKEAADKEQIEAHAKEELSSATIESPDIVAATSSVEKTFVETAINVGAPVVEAEKAAQPEKEEKHEKDRSLSAEEMDAISQLISQDPVSKERAELQKIKAAMKAEEKVKEKEKVSEDAVSTPETVAQGTAPDSTSVSGLPMSSEEADKFVADAVASIDGAAAAEAASSTIVTSETSAVPIKPDTTTSDAQEEDEDDPIVARLKKRVASMVGKIEAQLSETEVKIGDKLHFLDKDKDGILSREEMADVLKSVLKRELTSEEALEIADAMDENKDGIFTIAELNRWIDENKLVRFFAEGRDDDIQQMMNNASSQQPKKEESANVVGTGADENSK